MNIEIQSIADFQQLIIKIKSIPLDADRTFVLIDYRILKDIFHLFKESIITQDEFIHFIDLVETRDGVDFENHDIKEFVHLISNYEIHNINILSEGIRFFKIG